jgi:hypothetical protein
MLRLEQSAWLKALFVVVVGKIAEGTGLCLVKIL